MPKIQLSHHKNKAFLFGFYCIFDQINSALVMIRDFFQIHNIFNIFFIGNNYTLNHY